MMEHNVYDGNGSRMSTAASAARDELINTVRRTVVSLCRRGLLDGSGVESVEGLIGVTLNSHEVFLISIGEKLGHNSPQTALSSNPSENVDSNFCVHLPIGTRKLPSSLSGDNPDNRQTTSTNDGSNSCVTKSGCSNVRNDLATYSGCNSLCSSGTDETPTSDPCIPGGGDSAMDRIMNIVKFHQSMSDETDRMAGLESQPVNVKDEGTDLNQMDDIEMFIKSEPIIEDELSGNDDASDTADDLKPESGQRLPDFGFFARNNIRYRAHNFLSPLDSMSRMLPHHFAPSSTAYGAKMSRVTGLELDSQTEGSASWNTRFDLLSSDLSNSGNSASGVSQSHPSTDVMFPSPTGMDAEARPFTCRLCDASFSKKFCLANHIVTIHQVGGKYVCNTCGKQFLQRLRYMTHIDRHDNVRRHVCTACGKAFTYKYSLWSHAKKCSAVTAAVAIDSDVKPPRSASAAAAAAAVSGHLPSLGSAGAVVGEGVLRHNDLTEEHPVTVNDSQFVCHQKSDAQQCSTG